MSDPTPSSPSPPHAPSHTGHVHVEHTGEAPHHGVGHVVSPKILIATAAALLVLTFITVTSAKVAFEAVEMPELNIVVALGIALVKASLVCLFFMHLRWDRPFNAFVLVGSLGLVVLFITFALTDTNEYLPEMIEYQQSLPAQETVTIKAELDKLPPPLSDEQLHAAPAAAH
jgi:cytochrome c oxidase subunit 4